jgi:alpha-galactosidase
MVHLRAAGVSLVLDLGGPLPSVLHWGGDLGDLSPADLETVREGGGAARLANSPDSPRRFSVLPLESQMWSGVPAISGHRGGSATTPRPRLASWSATDSSVTLVVDEPIAGLSLTQTFRLTRDGILAVDLAVTAGAGDLPYDLADVNVMLPLPARATEILDYTGKWGRERSAQRAPLVDGLHSREVRRGKPGVDSPHLLLAGERGFGFRSGELWAMHLAWSGDQRWFVQRLPEGAGGFASVLGAGELLRPGEVRLGPGETFTAPTVLFAWSDRGIDGISDRFHAHLRHRPRPLGTRPLTLNTWEAVYFDHDHGRLTELVERAGDVGVERLVLDDGWFLGRRDDTRGLGDWEVDPEVWPDGLEPLVARIRGLGMEFGLWFEPEMVNPDSELVRAHPEWLLAPSDGEGEGFRHQHVLDIAHEGAYAHVLESISRLVARYEIDYLKWDHNRELHEAVRRDPAGDRPGVHTQTAALYRLLDELRARHPRLEIESCASGGGRVDLGILQRTDRVWASDTNDPIERQRVQLGTEALLPLEYIGAHVGAARSHVTHRVTDLHFRLTTALFGSAGIEWDITSCAPEELAALRAWAAAYRELRGLLHAGSRVHADLRDPATMLHGVVSADRSHALFAWVQLDTSAIGQPGHVPIPGLDDERRYRVRVRDDFGMPSLRQGEGLSWFDRREIVLPGRVLTRRGIPWPALDPAQALLVELTEL